MKYNISDSLSPTMPRLGKGLECIKILASQITPDMREAIVPLMFPALGAFINGSKFMYPDCTWKEPCGILTHLIGTTGIGKNQLTGCVEAIMRKFRQHDDTMINNLASWSKAVKSMGSNKNKPERPDVYILFPPVDTTNPAFLQNAMACEAAGNYTQYFNLPEIEMADRLCGGHKRVSQTIRNVYDMQRDGALRATADGVTGNPILRANMTFSSTPYAARKFYKNELYNGTFGRVTISYKPRKERSGKIPRQGKYDESVLKSLDRYLVRLETFKGNFVIPKLNKLIDKLAADMAELADLNDDDTLWDISKRSLVSAWKAGCVMYLLNGQAWTRSMDEMVVWLVYHDLWSKSQVFGDMLKDGDTSTEEASKSGPKNMLASLSDTFSETELEALRVSMDKSKDGAARQIRVWINRGFIERTEQTGIYTKTQLYLNRS